jgi:hypothetical protein
VYEGPINNCAKVSGACKVKLLELESIKDRLIGNIAYLETERLAQEKAKDLFESGETPNATTNLAGEFDIEVEKFKGDPQLYELLIKYKEVFGPLPPPQDACPLVQMDLILKPEWEGKALRQKCWPMPKVDQEELELQAEELVKAGLAEAYPLANSLKYAPLRSWLTKKTPKPAEW